MLNHWEAEELRTPAKQRLVGHLLLGLPMLCTFLLLRVWINEPFFLAGLTMMFILTMILGQVDKKLTGKNASLPI